MHGLDSLGRSAEFLADQGYMLVEGAGVAEVIHAPDSIEQGVAREDISGTQE